MQKSAVPALLALVALAMLAAACSATGLGLGGDEAVIGSDTVPSGQAATDGETTGDDGLGENPTGGETPGDGPDSTDSALGSTDPSPELSTDPDVDYQADTCHHHDGSDQEAVEVPCDQPHTIEVYANRDLPGDAGAPFLGLDAAIELCQEDFRAITGVGLGLATIFDRSVLRPSEETWADGERDVTCYVVYPEPVVGRLADIDPVRGFGRVSVYGLEVGDCILDFDEAATWFTMVPCGEPHNAEVFIDFEYPDDPFPGDETIDADADDLCFGTAFEDYVGLPYPESSVFSLRSRPSVETWELGDRTINCILTDEQVHTESFRNSEL